MGILLSILCCIGAWFNPQPRPIALESSLLGSLPPELILYIAKFLPAESTASFSVCCWPIYSILESQYIKIMKDDQDFDRYNFLALLERDLPYYILCWYCRRLHAIKKAHQFLRHNNWHYYNSRPLSPCCKPDSGSMTGMTIHFAFSFTVFSMTMKLYRQGLDPSRLLKLMSRESEQYYNYAHIVEKRTVLSKIVAGSMFIREQRKFMASPTHPVAIPEYAVVRICKHINVAEWGTTVSKQAKWIESRSYQDGNRLLRCKCCFTEFRIDFKELGRRGNAIYVTKWQDLGQGVSFSDPKWQSLISERQLCKRVKWDLGSICSAFEGKEYFEFEFDSL